MRIYVNVPYFNQLAPCRLLSNKPGLTDTCEYPKIDSRIESIVATNAFFIHGVEHEQVMRRFHVNGG